MNRNVIREISCLLIQYECGKAITVKTGEYFKLFSVTKGYTKIAITTKTTGSCVFHFIPLCLCIMCVCRLAYFNTHTRTHTYTASPALVPAGSDALAGDAAHGQLASTSPPPLPLSKIKANERKKQERSGGGGSVALAIK